MSERKLARVVVIDSLAPIEGADRIELAMVGGWQVVVQKGLYKSGDGAVYFEVDSLLPTDHPAFASLTNLSSKLLFEINGKGYARIKTAKIRKQLSQGFLVPINDVIADDDYPEVDDDYTNKLGILKYEKSEERSMNNAGVMEGAKGVKTNPFPSFIPKTDQNRVQNVVARYNQAFVNGEKFEKTFKLDGSSITAWIKDGKVGVASRNVSFKAEDSNLTFWQTLRNYVNQVWNKGKSFSRAKWEPVVKADNNAFVQMAKNAGLIAALKSFKAETGRSIAIQGEMVGPSIQKNFEGVDSNQFYIYDVFDIDKQEYMLPDVRQELIKKYKLRSVPVAGIVELLPTVKEAIDDADGPSGLNGKRREGYVYKSMTRDFSFKVISNTYLLKED